MLSSPSSPLSCFSRTAVTLCSTTSGLAAGKEALTLTRVGASWGKSSRPRPTSATEPASSTSKLQTMVNTGRRRNGWEMDRKAAVVQKRQDLDSRMPRMCHSGAFGALRF